MSFCTLTSVGLLLFATEVFVQGFKLASIFLDGWWHCSSAVRWLYPFVSRLHLGKFGGLKIVIEQEHKLITSEIYRYIRHPIYLGFLFLFFGYTLSFTVLLTSLAVDVILFAVFAVFRNRMALEKQLLLSKFGKEYLVYLARTWRLIPFIY